MEPDLFRNLVLEARFFQYIECDANPKDNTQIFAYEPSIVAIEDYEAREENKKIVAASLNVAQKSLEVANAAKIAAIFSAILAAITLVITLVQ